MSEAPIWSVCLRLLAAKPWRQPASHTHKILKLRAKETHGSYQQIKKEKKFIFYIFLAAKCSTKNHCVGLSVCMSEAPIWSVCLRLLASKPWRQPASHTHKIYIYRYIILYRRANGIYIYIYIYNSKKIFNLYLYIHT